MATEKQALGDWGEIQVRNSGNFICKNKLYTRLYGGINYQIEHHLFPSICHVHYPKISKIVKDTCQIIFNNTAGSQFLNIIGN